VRIYKYLFDVYLKKNIQKSEKIVINKCYPSTISVQNELKTHIKGVY